MQKGFTTLHSRKMRSISVVPKGEAASRPAEPAFGSQPPVKCGALKRSVTGFSLLELLIVMSIVAVLATVGVSNYTKSQRQAVLSANAEQIKAILRLARQRAVGQEQGLAWGVRFDSSGVYKIFSGTSYATSSVTETFYLETPLAFSDPSSGTRDIVFTQRTGAVSAQADVEIQLPLESRTKRIRTYTSGLVEIL